VRLVAAAEDAATVDAARAQAEAMAGRALRVLELADKYESPKLIKACRWAAGGNIWCK
jgi:hypothetical protein